MLVNRPLNAFGEGGLLRLADATVPSEDADFDARLAAVAALEQEYRERIAARLRAAEDSDPPESFFRWADDLPEVAELDLNPVIAHADGCVAVDARIRIEAPRRDVSPKSW